MPTWLGRLIDRDEHPALLARAPLDLRVNRLKTTREAVQALWPDAVPIDGIDDALRLGASRSRSRRAMPGRMG